ncbi:MAG: AAA family ATPase [Paenibacillus macerans]|uniref:AAA family ATPase n=1 Tax=Paenibacillus macerans TaxID=44252 RepID=UPI001F116972|nr:AAA family ATPase [Paenibacillus macerans]MDU5947301.1 AAA family ATPase [Paenibacillus macerans]MDU7473592.1 AAA family ATPase [Paenibacillus macerans]MEC0139176.1 AAA family ATPase [Paenibacillus macerans]UMV47257.1 AAA family ATPase [Paenibacillus macerans]
MAMEATKLYTIKTDLVARMNEYMNQTHDTITELAKAMGVSRPALSRFLSGKYDAENTKLEPAIAKFLNEHSQVAASPAIPMVAPKFFAGRDARDILGLCTECQEYSKLGVVTGKTGYGKSHTLKHYAKMQRVAYIECDDSMGCKDLIDSIEAALGIPPTPGSIYRKKQGIIQFFEVNKGYLLIVDEADKLINKYTQKKMEILRSIYGDARVGLVIAGEPKLESLIKGYLERFANRVDARTALVGLTEKEVRDYLEGFPFEADALEEMVVRGTNSKTGCFRLLARTLDNVLRVHREDGGDTISLDTIIKASSMMML